MSTTIGTALTTSKQSSGYVVKNPHQVTNSFTIRDQDKAAATLKLSGKDQINQLKDFLKNYDMTSVSTNDLIKIGSMLYQNGLINEQVDAEFISGNTATDANGQQTDKDVKFNAIAMFNEMLADTKGVAAANPEFAMESQKGYQVALHSLIGANQAINALAYFSHSPHSNLSVNEQA